ncbi:MAG: CHC2 zinc finger domain-containing protein [Faecalibacillus faecis]
MPRLSNEKINEIRQSVDIVDVGNYLPLERRGRNYLARCPFHNDDRPSMSVSPEKQIIDVLYVHTVEMCLLLQDYLKISFMEAVKMVAQMEMLI